MINSYRTTFVKALEVVFLTLSFICLFIICESTRAESFPFRALHPGKSIPDVTFSSLSGDGTVSIHSFAGKPLVLVFWGGDLPAKKKRSSKVLSIIGKNLETLKKKNVSLLAVNAQNDSESTMQEVLDAAGFTAPVYVDSSRKAYGSFGIYVLPSVLFVNAEGKVTGGIGYSKDFDQRFMGEVDVMLGTKTRKELKAELNPVMKEMPKEEKLALRHMNMGKTMQSKGMLEAAEREYLKALELNPKLAPARVGLGCIYVEQDKLDEAIKELETGLDQQPDLVEAEICLAKVSAKMGEVQEALEDMQTLLFRNGRNADLHFMVGSLQEQLGNIKEAAAEYKKAYELLKRKTVLHEEQ
ncbi:MAG: redoxin family protein [Thermodesulfobacteria bacterium]|nr:redoxin family protein [Thermodesulfobacteriota bacterium]